MIFGLCETINQVSWLSLSAVSNQVADNYEVSQTLVHTVALCFPTCFLIFTFPSIFVINRFGCRNGVVFGAFVNAAGQVIKCFVNHNFYWCLVGNILAAVGQPFLINATAKLAQVWFGPNERVIALTIAIAAQALGSALGFVFPGFWVTDDDTAEVFRQHIQSSFIVAAGLGGACFLAALLFFKDKPKTPPSATAMAEREDGPGEFVPSIKKLFKVKEIWVLFLIFGQIQGTFSTLGTVMGSIADQFDYTVNDISSFGAVFILGGIIGSALFGINVEKTQQYKRAVTMICILSCLATIGLLFAFPSDTVWLVNLGCFLEGFATVPIIAIAFDFGAELTYPVG